MLLITSSGVAIGVLVLGMFCEGSWMVPLRYVTEKRKLVSVFLLFFDWYAPFLLPGGLGLNES